MNEEDIKWQEKCSSLVAVDLRNNEDYLIKILPLGSIWRLYLYLPIEMKNMDSIIYASLKVDSAYENSFTLPIEKKFDKNIAKKAISLNPMSAFAFPDYIGSDAENFIEIIGTYPAYSKNRGYDSIKAIPQVLELLSNNLMNLETPIELSPERRLKLDACKVAVNNIISKEYVIFKENILNQLNSVSEPEDLRGVLEDKWG